VVLRARERATSALAQALVVYHRPEQRFCPAYAIGYGGEVEAICDEALHANHVGLTRVQREAFLSGAWPDQLPAEVVALWRARWPGVPSPAHLYPGTSPNDATIGVELVPLLLDGHDSLPPAAPGRRYTAAQHDALAALCRDVGERHGWPAGWELTGRLAGHEDLNPLDRTTRHPPAGWDPGGLRPEPWIDWGRIRAAIGA
jgi:hypothetical protein